MIVLQSKAVQLLAPLAGRCGPPASPTTRRRSASAITRSQKLFQPLVAPALLCGGCTCAPARSQPLGVLLLEEDPLSSIALPRPLRRLCAASLNESEQHHIFRWAAPKASGMQPRSRVAADLQPARSHFRAVLGARNENAPASRFWGPPPSQTRPKTKPNPTQPKLNPNPTQTEPKPNPNPTQTQPKPKRIPNPTHPKPNSKPPPLSGPPESLLGAFSSERSPQKLL